MALEGYIPETNEMAKPNGRGAGWFVKYACNGAHWAGAMRA